MRKLVLLAVVPLLVSPPVFATDTRTLRGQR